MATENFLSAFENAFIDGDDALRMIAIDASNRIDDSFSVNLFIIKLFHENISGNCYSFEGVDRHNCRYEGRYNFMDKNDCFLTKIA